MLETNSDGNPQGEKEPDANNQSEQKQQVETLDDYGAFVTLLSDSSLSRKSQYVILRCVSLCVCVCVRVNTTYHILFVFL